MALDEKHDHCCLGQDMKITWVQEVGLITHPHWSDKNLQQPKRRPPPSLLERFLLPRDVYKFIKHNRVAGVPRFHKEQNKKKEAGSFLFLLLTGCMKLEAHLKAK